MFARLARWGLILALVLSIGLQWLFVQSAAWVGMIVTYAAERGSLVEAVADTFDGQHPCKLCLAVEEGRKKEQKSPQGTDGVKKLELGLPPAVSALHPPPRDRAVYDWGASFRDRNDPPLLGPPRGEAA